MVTRKKDLFGTTNAPTGQVSTPRLTAENNTGGGSGIPRGLRVDDSQAIANCKAQGGRWDATTRTCILPQKEDKKDTPGIFTDEKGSPTGFTGESGNIFLGAKPGEVEAFAQSQFEGQPGQATQQIMAQQAQAQAQQQGEALALQLGQPVGGMEMGATPIDYGQAAGAGVVGGLLGGAGIAAIGAIGGAALGTLIAPGIGTAAGAAGGAKLGVFLGALSGFIAGARSNIAGEMSGQISASSISQRQIEQRMKAIVTDTNRNPQNAGENVQMFNYLLSQMQQEHSKLKLETSRDLNRYLGRTGTAQLQRYDLFFMPNGQKDFLTREMQLALLNPNPSRSLMTMEDLDLSASDFE